MILNSRLGSTPLSSISTDPPLSFKFLQVMIDVDIGRWVKFLRSLFVDDLDNLPGVHRPLLCYAGENLLLSLLSVLDVELNLLHGIRHNRTVAGVDDSGSQLQDL